MTGEARSGGGPGDTPAGPGGRPAGEAGSGAASSARDDETAEASGVADLPIRAALVFVAPGTLFDRLGRNPAWMGMLALAVVLSVGSVYVLPTDLMEQLIRSQMDAEAAEADVQTVVGAGRWLAYTGAVLIPPMLAALLAGLLYFTYTLMLGGRGDFAQLFSAAVHATLIVVVGELVLSAVMIAGGDPEIRLALHLLLPGLDPDTYAYAFLRGLNVFSLWTAAVLGIAVGRLYDRRSGGAAAALLIGLYVAMKAAVPLVAGG